MWLRRWGGSCNQEAARLTNKIAIWIACILVGLICIDALINDWGVAAFLAKKFVQFIDWVKFWR